MPKQPSKLVRFHVEARVECKPKLWITIFQRASRPPSRKSGIFLPDLDELFLDGVTSKVTSDCIVDRLIQWWETVKDRFSHIKTLVLNLDNGEDKSQPTHPIHATPDGICRPVSHHCPFGLLPSLVRRKYNPVERCWGVLEHHWNTSLLDSTDVVIQYAKTMVWKGSHPIVELVTTIYETGVKLTEDAMDALEKRFERFPLLGKWFVDIKPSCTKALG